MVCFRLPYWLSLARIPSAVGMQTLFSFLPVTLGKLGMLVSDIAWCLLCQIISAKVCRIRRFCWVHDKTLHSCTVERFLSYLKGKKPYLVSSPLWKTTTVQVSWLLNWVRRSWEDGFCCTFPVSEISLVLPFFPLIKHQKSWEEESGKVGKLKNRTYFKCGKVGHLLKIIKITYDYASNKKKLTF